MKTISKKISVIILCMWLLGCFKQNKKQTNSIKHKNQWISLFNGKNLNGWTPKFNGYPLGVNYKNTFKVENGILKVSYSQYDTFTEQYGHLFYKSPFSNYKLRLQYRFTGQQVNGGQDWAKKNSGIMLHCQAPESMLINQAFPISLEAQLLGGITIGKSRPSGNLCTPGTHVEMNGKKITAHCIDAECETIYGHQWTTIEIHVKTDSITHFINDSPVISYTKPTLGGLFLDTASKEIQAKKGQLLTKGYISLQSESHPVEFKTIELIEL